MIAIKSIIIDGVFTFISFWIRIYLIVTTNYLNMIPKYTLICSLEHKNQDMDFTVHEYACIANSKSYMFRFIECDGTTPPVYIDDNDIHNLYIFNLCYTEDNDSGFIRDITVDVRKFVHLLGKIQWKYILVHLNIESHKTLIFHMNDDDLTEKRLCIQELLKDDKVFSVN